MDTLFGITGKDFAITAYDSKAVASITLMKIGEDKSRELNPHTLMLFSGEPGDGVHFSEYIERNIKLYGIRHGIEMSPRAVASFARRELADSLRSRVRKERGTRIHTSTAKKKKDKSHTKKKCLLTYVFALLSIYRL